MPTLFFKGRVRPASLLVTIDGLRPFTSVETATREVMQLDVSVKDSEMTVRCELEHYDIGDDISIIHTRATHLARAVLDGFAFVNGLGIMVLLDEMVDVDGISKKVSIRQDELKQYVTAFKNADGTIDYDGLVHLVAQDPDLSLAINDLVTAVTIPGLIAINCGRAIEALRAILVPIDPTRKAGWAELRRVLQLEESYIKFVTSAAANPRHGSDRYLPSRTAHQEVMERAWVIMNRFMEYKKRGAGPLPVSEFPVR